MYCPIIEDGKGHNTEGNGKEKTFHMMLQLVREALGTHRSHGRTRGGSGQSILLGCHAATTAVVIQQKEKGTGVDF